MFSNLLHSINISISPVKDQPKLEMPESRRIITKPQNSLGREKFITGDCAPLGS